VLSPRLMTVTRLKLHLSLARAVLVVT